MFIIIPSESAHGEIILAQIVAITQERDRSIDNLRSLHARIHDLDLLMQKTVPRRNEAIEKAGPIELVQLLKEAVDEMEERNNIVFQISDTILRIRQCVVMLSQLRFVLAYNDCGIATS